MAETNGLLNRRTGKSGTEGSNPSVSARPVFARIQIRPEHSEFAKYFAVLGTRPFTTIRPNPCLKLGSMFGLEMVARGLAMPLAGFKRGWLPIPVADVRGANSNEWQLPLTKRSFRGRNDLIKSRRPFTSWLVDRKDSVCDFPECRLRRVETGKPDICSASTAMTAPPDFTAPESCRCQSVPQVICQKFAA